MLHQLKTKNIITLGEIRDFFNNECFALPKDTPILISTSEGDNKCVGCYSVLADEDSVEFFDL